MNISVVMAVYNGQAYLEQAVDSILAQTYGDFEFVIVDDGSTDRTWEMLSAITDSRVKAFRLPSNLGTPDALNTAVNLAKGDWIAVQDADDISLSERLAAQAAYIKEHPELIAVGSRIACIGEGDVGPERLRRVEANLNYGLSREQLYNNRYFVCALCHGTALYSKAHFMNAGGYDPAYRITHDYDLWLKLFQLGPIEKVDRVLYRYRVHSDSLSHNNGMATYTEKLICCIRRICQYEYKRRYGPVNLIVFANSTLSRVMEEAVIPNCPVRVHSYFENSAHAEYAWELFDKGGVDGIVLLPAADRNALNEYFEGKGMSMNKTLFWL